MYSMLKHCGPIIVSRPPKFAAPTSQLVSAAQFYEPEFVRLVQHLGLEAVLDRKIWEYCFIVNVIERYAATGPGTRGLAFGCGKEFVSSVLAAKGSNILATDYVEQSHNWQAHSLEDLFSAVHIDRAAFDERVRFQHLDMNEIYPDLTGFDFLWSTGSLEHIGGYDKGLAFVENAMRCLKPGGIAVHTTEFTLSSEHVGLDSKSLSFYCRMDIERLAEKLLEKGDMMVLNFDRGNTVADNHVDTPPYNYGRTLCAHHSNHVISSIGLVIQKG
jgi:SAM-dependent methyltransferase